MEAFAEGEAAIAPIYSIEDIVDDPQYLARETIVRVPHPKLGSVLMQNVIPRLSDTPGRIRHPGAEIGEHNEEIYCGELGLSTEELEELEQDGVI
jgi:formyl-CoA transferase